MEDPEVLPNPSAEGDGTTPRTKQKKRSFAPEQEDILWHATNIPW